MIPDQDGERLLECMIEALRAQPIPAGPPDDVHQRVVALGEVASRQTALGPPSYRAWLTDWIGIAAVAAALLAAVDLGWWIGVNATTPVGWFRDPATDTWRVLYDNTRVEMRSPPAAIRKDA
jgi:hypothetical protein